jgi:hypothetical protein
MGTIQLKNFGPPPAPINRNKNSGASNNLYIGCNVKKSSS